MMASLVPEQPPLLPVDPLEKITIDPESPRRAIAGVLESYNSNYDVLAEAVQNAIDAVEDASLEALPPPYLIEVTIHLAENWLSVMDTGTGMSADQVCRAFAPNVSFKDHPSPKRAVAAYRGYKGVGLTFLAYGSDNVTIHSKQQDGSIIMGRMQYGRKWVTGELTERALIVENGPTSPLDSYQRGTYVRVQLSPATRPRSLTHIAAAPSVWTTILRTRTAIGQILLGREPLSAIDVRLKVIDQQGKLHEFKPEPSFLLPSAVRRTPSFRFLDVPDYFRLHAERSDVPTEKQRQDGLFLIWNTEKINQELTADDKERFAADIQRYSPRLYAFVPYQGSVWADLNEILTATKSRSHLYPGLIIAVNRQRLADVFPIDASRYETFSRNVMVIVHFDDAKPDQGRKTLQEEVLELAKRSADRAVQYLGKNRALLRPAGESPTPQQRQVEKSHADWIFNVKTHAKASPLHLPPATFASAPLTEQDVVGLFHQLSALGVFPGIRIFATSQTHTYDSLVQFECPSATDGLLYVSSDRRHWAYLTM